MAPKSPWKINTKKTVPVASPAKPSPAAVETPTTAINYGEIQDEEIAVLQAIYMDDYEALEVKGAWSKTTDKSFRLKIRSFSDPESCIQLSVTFTATYPRTAPLLEARGLEAFHERTQKRIERVIRVRPQSLLGEVMIHVLCEEIQDALEDAVISRQQGTLPSLEDERANAEEAANTLAKKAEEAEARQLQEAQEEEDRMLKQMVSEEVHRREKRKPAKSINEPPPSDFFSSRKDDDSVSFDNPITIHTQQGVETFKTVSINCKLSQDAEETVFLGSPQDVASRSSAVICVKRRRVKKDRDEIIQLEATLDAAQKLRHSSLLNLLAYRMVKIDSVSSDMIICQEHGDRGTLKDLLSVSNIHLEKGRQWTVELLEGLDFLHHNGMAHGSLSAQNIILTGQPVSPKMADFGFAILIAKSNNGLSPKWQAPEDSVDVGSQRKADIWNLGVVVVQMFLGLNATVLYHSPAALNTKLDLSDAFQDFLNKIFSNDARKRPSAFDLLPAEFLRTESSVLEQATLQPPRHHHRQSSSGFGSPLHTRRSRHNSSSVLERMSRYLSDFTEIGRLGKGGFGEVVKARNKLDGGIYAVKKIRQAPQLLDQVLSEVMLLNRLNHPYVVRYFSTWVENDAPGAIQEEAISTTEDTLSDGPQIDFGYASTGGLDFVSSSGFEMSDDDDDSSSGSSTEDDDDGEDFFERGSAVEDDSNAVDETTSELSTPDLRLHKSRSDSRRLASTLYIQMEYCERRTLRDLIHKGMEEDDCWRYIRQITEGLAHIHSHGIIHRDLKPDNIFLDVALLPKIGDFGLATTGQYQAPERHSGSKGMSIDMTRSIGTALYTAPELRSNSGSSYNDKVDIYSLGIIFFEMNMPFSTAMERINELQRIREKNHELPAQFQKTGDKAAQGKLVEHLISHKPSERPSSTELLRSDILPLKIEDETIRQALSGLQDPRSPYHQKMMSALFAHDTAGSQRVKALAWEAKAATTPEDTDRVRFRGIVRSSLESVFRRHGAEEFQRDSLLPRSALYTNPNVVQLLDASGNLLQLPYDLTLPHARQLARQPCNVRCNFAFGFAYRDAFTGGPPRVNEEADFDIIDSGCDDNIVLNDAEAVKVIDEVISELPNHSISSGVSVYINHGKLLDAILDHCRVSAVHHPAVKEILSKLGFQQWTWAKIRSELRNSGLPDTTLDDLQQFDFRETPLKALLKLQALFDQAAPQARTKCSESCHHLKQVVDMLEKLGTSLKLSIAPLSCFNAKFYENGILLQCVVERKSNRVAIAAGGRYDSLIQKHRPAQGRAATHGAVGICIGVDALVSHMIKNSGAGSKTNFMKNGNQDQRLPKRCDVLVVASGGAEDLQDAAVRILSSLWANDISAELSRPESVEKSYLFIVTLRHAASNSVKVTSMEGDGSDTDVATSSLVSHIQHELRERAGKNVRIPLLRHSSSHHDGGGRSAQQNTVQVLMARHGSKKSNKYHIVEAAQQRWAEKLEGIKRSARILAVEIRDDVLDIIQQTTLNDAESWRRAIQSVQLSERQYVQQVEDVLDQWKRKWNEADGPREACVFNFRTGKCIYYDLGL